MEGQLVVFVGTDLAARSRIESAVENAGMRFATSTWEGSRALEAVLVLVDLDEAGPPPSGWADGPPQAIGYFSHVDEALGTEATAAGVTALPRSRFWRELPDILARVAA